MRLTLFFTRGVGLQIWDSARILTREVALYRSLQDAGVEVGFVTYGGAADVAYAEQLGGIRILCNRWGWPRPLYERALPWLHAAWLKGGDVVKSNQTNGAEIALRAARYWGKTLVARCGYMWSDFAAREHGAAARVARGARRIEQRVFSAAQRIVVTTTTMQQDVIRRVPRAAARTVVIPNYVDVNHFRPLSGPRDGGEIIFVGRLTPQKNVSALLEASRGVDWRVTLVGDGQLREDLARRFADLGTRVRWCGNVANATLPEHLGRAALFVLPSHYEGHPKALLEAMACGVAVIGADSPGIRELIQHGETGWLCGTDPDAIRDAIRALLGRPSLRAELGRNARQFVQEHFSLERVVERELSLYRELTGGRNQRRC